MKIALLSYETDAFSGWGTVTKYVTENLKKLGHEVVIFDYKSGQLKSFESYSPTRLIKDWWTIRRELKDSDLIISLCEPFFNLALMCKFLEKKKAKLIALGHGTYIYFPFLKGLKSKINRFVLNRFDLVLVPSSFTKNRVKEFHKKENLKVWPLGIDCSVYYAMEGFERELSVISVGDPKPRKGTEVLLRSFSRVLKEFPDSKLYVIGISSDYYKRIAISLGLETSVFFTGKVSHGELLSYYSRCKVHVLPSVNTPDSFEGFGLVHLEANACGVPTIGSLGTANDEIIIDGYNGFLCRQNDESDISTSILELFRSNDLFEKMSSNARNHALFYSWENATLDFLNKIGSYFFASNLDRSRPIDLYPKD